MKKMIMLALALVTLGVMAGDPRVENVRARQIPDTKDVEVIYDLVAPDGGLFNVSATFQMPGVAPEPETVTGDFGSNVAPGRNRRFVWDAGTDWTDNVNSNFISTVSVKEQDNDLGGVQLWEGGPYWAECNVGASKPEECGLYFWWGDTEGHAGDWTFDYSHCPTYGKNNSELQSMGYIDSTGNLTAAHDAATANLGAPWRMPTDWDFVALIRNCTMTRTSRNGVNGLIVTGKGVYVSKSVFFPATGYGYYSNLDLLGSSGYYWSSRPDSGYCSYAWYLGITEYMFYRNNGMDRSYGMSVRPVRAFPKSVKTPRFASGTTAAEFVVDTRDKEFRITDVKTDYCWGKYHDADGHNATFLSGVSLNLDFKIKVDHGPDCKRVDYYEYGVSTTSTDEFKMDVGALAPGTKLEVIAVAADGTRSKPFRVNFDIASVPESIVGFHVTQYNIGDSVVYEAENAASLVLFDEVKDAFQFFDNAPDVYILPEISFDVTVDSASGEYAWDFGLGAKSNPFADNATAQKKLGKLAGADFNAVLTGGPKLKWNPSAREWQEGSTSVGVRIGASVDLIEGRIPQTLGIVHYAFGLEGQGEFAGTWTRDGKFNFTATCDPLLGVTASLGAGIKILADIEGYVKGGVLLSAQGPNTPHLLALGFRGGVGYDVYALGFKITDGYIDWTQYLRGGPTKSAVRLMNAFSAAGLDGYAAAQPISRNYLRSPKKMRLMTAGNGAEADERIVIENGYQWPDPTVAASGTRHVLAYLVDDLARNDVNRTKLVCSADDGAAETVWDDGTPDFKPSVGMAADGTVVLAWMNGKESYAANATAPIVFAGSELAVAVRNAATGQWTCQNLTNDAVLDRAPLVRVTPDGKACVLWVRNAACDPFGSATEKNEMWGVVYDGAVWGTPTKLFELGTIGGFDFHYGRESGSLAATFALAELNGAATSVQQSVRYGRWSGGAGSVTPQVYREIDLESASPYVYADKGGSLKLLWGESGGIRTRTFASDGIGLTVEDECACAFGGDGCGAFTLAKGANGQLAVIGSRPNAQFPWTSDPVVCHYNANANVWSGAVPILDNDRVERSLDAVLDGSGNLIAAYASVLVTKAEDGTLTFGAVDVRTLTKREGVDLAVSAADIAFADDSDFENGGKASVVVKLHNLGNVPVLGVPVKVSIGQDEESVEAVSDPALTVDFAAGGVTNVTVGWSVNMNVSNLIVRVEIDPENTVNDVDRSNNTATREAAASLRIVRTRVRADVTANARVLTATIFNGGFKAVPAGTTVTFVREDGTEIGRDLIGQVLPGESGQYEASIVWGLAGCSSLKDKELVTVKLLPPTNLKTEENQFWTATLVVSKKDTSGDQKTYSVQYQAGSYGSGSSQTAMKTEGQALELSGVMFTRTGYTQTGWSRNADGSTKDFDLGAAYEDDVAITLYPYWTEARYSIAYVMASSWSNDSRNPDSYSLSELPIVLHPPVFNQRGGSLPTHGLIKDKDVFLGWDNPIIDSGTCGDLTIVGRFVQRTMEPEGTYPYQIIIFDPNGGEGEMSPQSLRYTPRKAVLLAANCFTRRGYGFLGWSWSQDGEIVYGDGEMLEAYGNYVPYAQCPAYDSATLYAKWGANSYSICYELAGGHFGSVVPPANVNYDEIIGVHAPIRDGFAFDGWTVKSTDTAALGRWGVSTTLMNDIESVETRCFGEIGGIVYFQNLEERQGETAVLTALWKEDPTIKVSASVKLPTSVVKEAMQRCPRWVEKTGSSIETFGLQQSVPGKVDSQGNQMYVWQDILAGTDPADLQSKFISRIEIVDGKPIVKWEPDLNNGGTKYVRKYTTFGCKALDCEWANMDTLTEDQKMECRFFKVTVELP